MSDSSLSSYRIYRSIVAYVWNGIQQQQQIWPLGAEKTLLNFSNVEKCTTEVVFLSLVSNLHFESEA